MAEEDKSTGLVSRISVSLPPALLEELDGMVASRGYGSRSQAIGDMVNYQLADHKRTLGNEVMVGTITLLYDRLTRGLQKKLADLQYENLDEVISSLHVHLTEDQIMEVILVQGPADTLQEIGPSEVWVTLGQTRSAYVLQIRDDGVGMDAMDVDKATSHGIRGMRERARQLGGMVTVTSERGDGTTLMVTIPKAEAIAAD